MSRVTPNPGHLAPKPAALCHTHASPPPNTGRFYAKQGPVLTPDPGQFYAKAGPVYSAPVFDGDATRRPSAGPAIFRYLFDQRLPTADTYLKVPEGGGGARYPLPPARVWR